MLGTLKAVAIATIVLGFGPTGGLIEAAGAAPPSPGVRSFSETESVHELRAREEWFFRQRAYPGTTVPKGALVRALAQSRPIRRPPASPFGALRAPALGLTSAPSSGGPQVRRPLASALPAIHWTELGPRYIGVAKDPSTPWAGRVSAIATDPSDPNTVYVAGAAGGVWKTTDAGARWTALLDAEQAVEAVTTLTLDPNDHGTVYAGTGDPSGYGGTGLYRSQDGGVTWTKLPALPADGCSVSAVGVQSTNSNALLATVSSSRRGGGVSCATGVYRSLDAGATWTRELAGEPTDLAASPGDSSVWYAGFEGYGIWRSRDGGSTWARLGGGLPTGVTGRVELAVAPSDRRRLYAVFAAPSTQYQSQLVGIWTSSDAGDSWQGPIGQKGSRYLGAFGWYALEVTVDPADPNVFYVGDQFLGRFTHVGGDAKVQFGKWEEMHPDFHALAFDAAGGLWIGTDGGVYRSMHGLKTIRNRNGNLSLTQVEPGTSGSLETRLVAGTQDTGAILRERGLKWSNLGPCDGGYTATADRSPSAIYFTSQSSGCGPTYIYKSTDGGTSYAPSGAGIDLTENAQFYAPLRMNPADPTRLYTGRRRLWESTDSGASWHTLTGAPFGSTVNAIGTTNNPSALYVGTTGFGTSRSELQVTKDGGATWVDTSQHGLPNASVTSITVAPTDSAVAYATVSGFGTGHVFKTTSSGEAWVDVSGNLPTAVPVNAIAVDWRTTPAALYIGTDVGMFWSVDEGATWQNTSDGMPPTVVTDIRVDAGAGRLLAATYGRGMFSAPLPWSPG